MWLAYLKGEGVVMVRVTEVPVVEQPHVPHFPDLVVLSVEELVEVLAGLHQVRQPNQGWEVGS